MAAASAVDVLCDGQEDVRLDEGSGWAEPKRLGEILPAVLARLGLDGDDLGERDW